MRPLLLLGMLQLPVASLATALAQIASPLAEWQIALDRQNFSPGFIDGKFGPQTRQAIMAWQEANGLRVDGAMGPETERPLIGTNTDWFTQYTITEDDLKSLGTVSETWKGKSEQAALPYETLMELIAERFRATEQFIRTLNSDFDFARAQPGQVVQVPNVLVPRTFEKAAVVRVKLDRKVIVAYGDRDQIIGFFPCSIGKDKSRRPVGELKVAVFAPNPNFTWDPAVFTESPESQTIRSKLIIPPGPNNPVGAYWLGLSLPGYGIHGTPRPEDIGKTESHGCFRLANWNVETLAKMVEAGTPVIIEP
jgi:lipoprotein-anchoring transpeptidase ErfK/SrfK